MAVIINGDTGIDKITDGSVVAADLASTLDLSSKTITLATDAVDQLSTASGSAPSYSARAWVNFNGSGTVAIRASGNVSSITDNGTGDYTVNFTTSISDSNYSVGHAVKYQSGTTLNDAGFQFINNTGNIRVFTTNNSATKFDFEFVCVQIFR